MLVNIAALIALAILNIVFSAAETSLFSANISKVKEKAKEGNKKAIIFKEALKNKSKFLTVTSAGMFLTSLLFTLCTIFSSIEIAAKIAASILHVVLIFVVASYIFFILGQITAKRVALKNCENVGYALIGFVVACSKILFPITAISSFISNLIIKAVGVNMEDKKMKEEEFYLPNSLITEITESRIEMINNVFEFDDKIVGDIAIHRKDIVALDVSSTMEEITTIIKEQKYSRIPIYEENIDNIIGILHIKDFLQYILNNNGKLEAVNLRKMLYKPYFFPISKKTDELFNEMKLNKTHIAIIIDEYGGTAGLVTMEDLIEEIMGNILDEYDDEELPDINKIDENTYEINGTASLEAVSDVLDISLPTDQFDTLGGFLIGQIGHIPKDGEKPEIEFGGMLFKVNKSEGKRIGTVLVCKI